MAGHYATTLNRKLTKAMRSLNTTGDELNEILTTLNNNRVYDKELNSIQKRVLIVEDIMFKWMTSRNKQERLQKKYYKGA